MTEKLHYLTGEEILVGDVVYNYGDRKEVLGFWGHGSEDISPTPLGDDHPFPLILSNEWLQQGVEEVEFVGRKGTSLGDEDDD